jgi:glycosyltransferase involved in cell wall biosynthesis
MYRLHSPAADVETKSVRLDAKRPKLLVLTPRYPYPVVGGDRLRIYNVCKVLAEHMDLTLLSFCDRTEELEHQPDDGVFVRIERIWLPRWRSALQALMAVPTRIPLQLAYYRNRRFRDRVEALLSEHDAVLAHLIRTGQYIESVDRPAYLEMTDAISLNYSRVRTTRSVADPRSWIYRFEEKRLARYERAAVRRFDAVTLVCDIDREWLLEGEQNDRLLVCSNGVDLNRLPWAPPDRKPIVIFIGNMRSMQNFDACWWFATEVLPRLRERAPFEFRVIGRIDADEARRLRTLEGVEVTGEVPDVAAAAHGALAGVCSVRIGAGVQNKVLEYMALGVPTVTTSVGLEGLSATPETELLVADDPIAFVDSLMRLYGDASLALKLAFAGRAFIERQAAWSTHLQPLTSRIVAAVASSDAMPPFAPERVTPPAVRNASVPEPSLHA